MNWNPFDLKGPEFLAFYAALFAGLALLLYLARRKVDAREDLPPPVLPEDAYEMAYLKGGRNHVIRVALLALLDRELLVNHGSEVGVANAQAYARVTRPLDRTILVECQKSRKATDLFHNQEVKGAADELGEKMAADGLVPDAATKVRRYGLFFFGLVLWLGVGGTKFWVALSRGKTNVLFLMIMAVLGTIVLKKLVLPHRTHRGGRVLKKLQDKLDGLSARGKYLPLHRATNELTLVAAVLGISALPTAAAEMLAPLRIKQVSGGGSGCGGSSCSGCSGGSSCGGGGGCGGGGCGGCGG